MPIFKYTHNREDMHARLHLGHPQVSRERVGCELDQMVRSASPLRAFELMDGMKILPVVFPLPEGFVLPMDDDTSRAYEFGMVYLKVRRRERGCC